MPTVSTSPQNLLFCPSPFAYRRRPTRVVWVGEVGVGGNHPLRIQSMTTTRTQDTEATVNQVVRLLRAGCEIVRVTAPTETDAAHLKHIAADLRAKGLRVPLVADIHFRPEAALEAAEHVEKVRINPGNYTDAKAFKVREYTDTQYEEELVRLEERFTPLVLKLKRLGRALRIGTNHGSLSDRILNRYGDTPEGMVESALEFVRICEKNGYRDIILSMKASNPKIMIAAYRLLAARMTVEKMDYPFHLGVTEAGDGEDGRIKSAVGIGTLLEDGIGDTLRVSLTEEPECEIPVARQLAALYDRRSSLPPEVSPVTPAMPLLEDPFHFRRRPTKEVRLGPIGLGALHPPRSVIPLDPATANPTDALKALERQLKSGQGLPPEIFEWPVRSSEDLALLEKFHSALGFQRARLGFLARLEDIEKLDVARSLTDGIILDAPLLHRAEDIAKSLASSGPPLWLRGDRGEPLLAAARAASAHTTNLVLSMAPGDCPHFLHRIRWLLAHPWIKEGRFPLHFVVPADEDASRFRLRASIRAGALLTDGFGDGVTILSTENLDRVLEWTGNMLQGAGARVTKAEFVSCPSCGRTLFDLQTTTDRIKKRTGHLVNIKIAIMGCIVNGPGEMADADFGYVGGGPDKINLYVGKECVEKGLPAAVADERLIAIIKEHGRWKDPQ